MAEYLINERVSKYLELRPAINADIMEKLKKCLDENLFNTLRTCNKHELKGNCKGYWRLHLPHDYVVIYVIEGESPNRRAHILKIMTNKVYHNWVKSC